MEKIDRESIIRLAHKAGFKASIGKTDKKGKYIPYINALGKEVPIEWLEKFAALVIKDNDRIKNDQ